ncbi:secretogranin-2 [Colossoma macropomum]|uniref:secretogranin-2 n=1 Tax=Colossoma macropomum TaxID=42526 RepID=UPI00186482D4|nr:secretogranin-2 [Colossoma macropomum]
MQSLPQLCAPGLSFVLSHSFLFLFLSLNTGVQGATLREPHLWGNELDTFRPSSQAPPPPNAAMLQALQYIQSLNQRTPHDPVTNNDLNDVRTMLQLAIPAKTSTGMHNGRGEEEERDGLEEKEEDKGQQWIQAVLSTLPQTNDQRTSLKTPYRATSNFLTPTDPLFPLSPAFESKQQQDRQSDVMNYGRSLWANQGIRRRHRKFPLMFKDEQGQDQPLKWSNENAEEQYTPQKLATLQSVFEELSRIVNSKADSKQQDSEDGEGDNSNEDDDEYREKKMVFEDVAGEEEELMPIEQKTEQEKEEAQRHEFNGGFGNEVEEEQDKEGSDAEGDDEDKRSNQPDLIEMEKVKDPDDINRLVNYYLMKVLENTGPEKQRRDQEKEKEQVEVEEESDREEDKGEQEEEEDEKRDKNRAAQLQYSVDPQSVYQLIQISKKRQVPSEDILDLLEDEETKKPDKSWQHTQAQSKTPSVSYTSSYNTYKNPATTIYQQPLKTPEKTRVTQNILRILGLANAAQPNNKSLLRPNQYKSALNYYMAKRELPDYTFSESSRDQHEADYDDMVGEDELASYLAAEMLAERQRRAPLVLEHTVQDYFVQDGKSMPEETHAEHEETAENSDEETLLRIMDYLNPESEDTDKMHINGKKGPGM